MARTTRRFALCALAVSLAALTVAHLAVVREHVRAAESAFPAKGDPSTARHVNLVFDGIERDYLLQVPEGAGPFPVVVLLHGGTQSARQAWRQTSLPTLGLEQHFILVAPDAIGGHWNDARGAVLGGGHASSADDVGFLRRVIADVLRDDHGDAHAVFMTGASNGGFMTMHFACEAGSLLRAAANVISDLPMDQQSSCKAPPMPWMSINGTDDPLVPFAGMQAGTIRHGDPQPALLSADETFQFWAKRDHCGPISMGKRLPHLNPADPTWLEQRTCSGKDGRRSVQIVVQGGGHSLPSLHYGPVIRAVVGRANQDVDSGELIWNFFKSAM